MTTRPAAQPGESVPEPGEPRDEVEGEPTGSTTRVAAIAVVFVLLLSLGVRAFVYLNRSRSGRDEDTSHSAPCSRIRIAAAPHSTVHVVSAPCVGHSEVRSPTRLATKTTSGRQAPLPRTTTTHLARPRRDSARRS
ncbi:hypothetical protein KDK95_21050 [Actinospica sp. MGRD01-02]|uniref:Uncharacterized protein n=1 Tax=Actinospica acidithermotolerans TaxID=2828514 RepID=A0A941IHR5_9ACTN|nr:hypothetical protein [Actinospica acidithermotolerans]MBR7828810.1 hypothetical protein [Actinospica acidithermotolerans]